MNRLLAILLLVAMVRPAWAEAPRKRFLESVPRRADTNPSWEESKVDPLLALVDPATYRLGPGDTVEVSLSFPGGQLQAQEQVVDPQGAIVCYQLGATRVSGMTLGETRNALRRRLSEYYRRFDLGLRLVRVRRFPVQVTGEVLHPGVYPSNGVMGVAEALVNAGGFREAGSMRRVALMEGNRVVRHLDLLRWLVSGDQSQNPTLMPGQLLVVPKLEQEVSLSGLVYEAGTFETLPGETVGSLMDLAGGVPPVADLGNVQVGRILPSGQRDLIRLDLGTPNSPDWAFSLQNGDQIEVFDKTLAGGRVLVIGELVGTNLFPTTKNQATGQEEVQRRGSFRLKEGQRLSDLVLALGGPTSKADLPHSVLERAGQSIPVDLKAALTQPRGSGDLVLQDGDTLMIPALADSVFVVGYAVRPGPYPFVPGYGVREYLALAGGPTREASTNNGRLVRRVPGQAPIVWEMDLLEVLEEGAEPQVALRPGDVIYIPLHAPVFNEILQILSSVFFFTSVTR